MFQNYLGVWILVSCCLGQNISVLIYGLRWVQTAIRTVFLVKYGSYPCFQTSPLSLFNEFKNSLQMFQDCLVAWVLVLYADRNKLISILIDRLRWMHDVIRACFPMWIWFLSSSLISVDIWRLSCCLNPGLMLMEWTDVHHNP